jgi:hypothetical protein
MKRISLEGKTFGNYHVLEYNGYDHEKRGAYYKCMDMATGKIEYIRSDHFKFIELNYQKTLKEIADINNYKKKHGLS